MAYIFKNGLPEVQNLEVDLSNSITRDLTFLAVPRIDGRPVDLVRGVRFDRNESTRTTRGVATNQVTASNASTSHLDYTSGAFTIWAYAYIANSSSGFYSAIRRARYVSESDNQGYGLETNSSNQFALIIFRNNGSASYRLTGGAYTTGFYSIAGTTDGTTKRIYNEGVETANSTTGNIVPVSNTGEDMRFGGWNPSAGNGTLIGGIWRRALSASEIQSLYLDPFQLVRVKQGLYRRVFVAGVPGPISGTSAVTAVAATLTASGTIVNAYTGTSTVTAAAATLTASGTVVNPATNAGRLMLLGIG